jgi:hypothetical protein
MSRRGLKWALVAASLVLLLLGIYLAWERHRYCLETSRGTVRIGMTQDEVRAVLGMEKGTMAEGQREWSWWGDTRDDSVRVIYGPEWRVTGASSRSPGQAEASIPRPSLVEVVRSWFTGKRED